MDVYHTNKKSTNWTTQEEILLVQSVQDRMSVLYGAFKGCTRGKQKRKASWEEVASIINAVSSGHPRTWDQAKKKYENLKTRTRAKLDTFRRPATGGGPCPPIKFTEAEEGCDTEAQLPVSASCSSMVIQGDIQANGNLCKTSVSAKESDVLHIIDEVVAGDSSAAHLPQVGCKGSMKGISNETNSQQSNTQQVFTCEIGHDGILKKKRKSYDDIRKEVLESEVLKLQAETQKIKRETEKLEKETDNIKLQKVLLQYKIQNYKENVDPSFKS